MLGYAKGYAGSKTHGEPVSADSRALMARGVYSSEISIWAYDIDTCLFQVRNLIHGTHKVRACFSHAVSHLNNEQKVQVAFRNVQV